MLQRIGFLFRACLLALSSLSALAATVKAQKEDSPPPPLPRFSLVNLDRSADACVDFYQYACGGLNASHPVPLDQPYSDPSTTWNEAVLRNALKKASVNDPKRNPNERKIGDYYSACMDEQGQKRQGIRALRPILDSIRAVSDKRGIAGEIVRLHRILYLLAEGSTAPKIFDAGSLQPLFGFYSWQDFHDATTVVGFLDQGGLVLGDRSDYLNQDADSVALRKVYLDYIGNMLALVGDNNAANEARQILGLETLLATSWMDNVKRQDRRNLEHRYTRDQLQRLMPSFSWDDYLREIGAPASPYYVVTAPEFFESLETLLHTISLDIWKAYLRWHLLARASPMLNGNFGEESFRFLKAGLGQQQRSPRWRDCIWATDRDLGDAVGPVYVALTLTEEDKQRVQDIAVAVERALETDIKALAWMTPSTRQEAITKLHGVVNRIGYPEHWKNYSALTIIRDSWLTNAFRAGEFEFQLQLNQIGKPVDRTEWRMTTETQDAYNTRQQNVITVSAAFLQPPTFDRSADDALNFGGIGYYVGHELIHGFDNNGRQFDEHGNLRDWWTPGDSKQFEQKAKCISDQYSQYTVVGNLKLNGEQTLAENIADAGGLRLALAAFKERHAMSNKIDGFSPEQRLFLSYGLQYCGNSTPEYERSVALTDGHATSKYRVNGVVSNMPEFSAAFGCKKGQPMVRENACRVW